MLNRGAFSGLLILGFLVLMTSWYSVKASTITPLNTATLAQTGQLEQGSVIQTNALGLISYQATVTDATQTGAGLIYFNNLKGTSYDSDRLPWLLSADKGTVSSNEQEVTLIGHVSLIRTATNNNPALSFATDSANIFPQTQIISGDDWLTITEAGTHNVLVGKGFQGDLAHKTYNLFSQVKGIYYAQP